MRERNRSHVGLVIVVIIAISLFVGAAVGGAVGVIIASSLNSEEAPMAVQGVEGFIPAESQPDLEPVRTAPPAEAGLQSLIVTEESASVDAVSKVLPAVVTVLSAGAFGGGSGTGFFVSEAGYVVTNNHVIEGARNIDIIYAQGGRRSATLVGTAPEFDLAVLKVDGPVPAFVNWGDSGELPLGAKVIAIGSALGQYQNSVTGGILSGFNRQLGGLGGLLQTDAAINQGNSGGPLINLQGQVIGINTLVARGDFIEAEGIGFAIPSNVARSVVGNLIATGDARHPFLGIQYQPLNPQLASDIRLNITQGALLETIIEGTPAARAGLRVGDVIVAIDGKPVDDRHSLVSLLLEHVAGDTIVLDVMRDGNLIQTQLTLGERA